MSEKTNLSVDEVADWLDVNPRTVYRLVASGGIPGFKVRGQWRFNREMLKEWVVDRVTIERLKVEEDQKPEEAKQ